ncbi:alkylated DNA repair protein alkB homolog-like 8 [Microdochium nivale]|nr:alkylated DNA repair protein alkB homolog-like 8 [Microdochium nivale]
MKVPDLQPVLPPPPPLPSSSGLCDAGGDGTRRQQQQQQSRRRRRTSFPRGLRMQRDFITPEHEAELMRVFREELEWPERNGGGGKAKGRLSLHYGYTFSYKTFGVDEDVPFREFPDWLVPLIPLLPCEPMAEEGEGEGDEEDEGHEAAESINDVEHNPCGSFPNHPDTSRDQGRKQQQQQQQQRRPRETPRQERQRRHRKLGGRPPDQVCLQYYPPGTGIPPHADTHSTYDELYALSLGSPVMMQFRLDGMLTSSSASSHGSSSPASPAPDGGDDDKDEAGRLRPPDGQQKRHNLEGELSASTSAPAQDKASRPLVEVDLPARSMLEMSGDSRLHWTHGIKSRKTDTLPLPLGSSSSPDYTSGGSPGEEILMAKRPREDRWSITYRWLRKETPEEGDEGEEEKEGERAGDTRTGKMTTTPTKKRRMVRECKCGDAALCDTAQRRGGQEREYRWKQYESTTTPAAAAPAAATSDVTTGLGANDDVDADAGAAAGNQGGDTTMTVGDVVTNGTV